MSDRDGLIPRIKALIRPGADADKHNSGISDRGFNAGVREAIEVVEAWHDEIAAEVKAKLGERRAQGKKTGGAAPYGYRVVDEKTGELAEDDAEQAAIVEAKRLKEVGLTLAAIATRLRQQGWSPRPRIDKDGRSIQRAKFHPKQISRMIKASRRDRTT